MPRELLITPKVASESKILQYLKANDLMENFELEKLQLTLYLMEELKNPETKWQDYFEMFPKDTNNFLEFFS